MTYLKFVIAAALSIIISHSVNAEQRTPAQKVYDDVSQSIFTVYSVDEEKDAELMLGSAVAVEDHVVATNCHVALAGNYLVVYIDKKPHLGRLYYYEKKKDLCLIEIAGATLKPVSIRRSKSVKIGEEVYAIGNPEGRMKTISRGIISNKFVNKYGVEELQTDAAISHGSSGGGLFDSESNLIGITTAGDLDGENIGFAIPTELILNVINAPESTTASNKDLEEDAQSTKSNKKTLSDDRSSKGLIRLGYYGNSEIGLMKWNNECFIAIPGRNSSRKPTSLALWYASTPNGLLIFSGAVNAEDAVKFLIEWNKAGSSDSTQSKSFTFFDKKLYPLDLVTLNNTKYPVYIFATKRDLTEQLVSLDDFLVQFYGYNYSNSMTTIKFGLDGFTEALAAYNKLCNQDE